MNGFDLALALLLATALVCGAVLGIVRIALGSLALIAGGVAAVLLAEPVAAELSVWIDRPELAHLAAFFGVYLACLLVGSLLGWLVRHSLRALGLRWVDRLAGAALAAAVVLGGGGLVAYAIETRLPESELLASSEVLVPLAQGTDLALQRLPELRRRIDGVLGTAPAVDSAEDGAGGGPPGAEAAPTESGEDAGLDGDVGGEGG